MTKLKKSPYRNKRQRNIKKISNIVVDVNADLVGSRASRKTTNNNNNEETDTKPRIVVVSGSPPPKRHKKRINDSERRYIVPLIEKYGNDYLKMKRDIKLNYLQMEEISLQKLVTLLQEDEQQQ
jgi:hypothetical protein